MNSIPKDLQRLIERGGIVVTGHREIDYGTQYHLARGSETVNLNVYRTKKVSVDGKSSSLKDLLEGWRITHQGAGSRGSGNKGRKTERPTARPVSSATPRLGTDEAGKGEYLGPLVVAGARVLGKEQDQRLRKIGVRDSKDLLPPQVQKVAEGVRGILGEQNVCVISLEPVEYEARRAAAGSNVNRLLGELNVEIIKQIGDGVELILVDQFGVKARSYIEAESCVPEGVRLEVRTRAEDDAAVAAASILARARYLDEMDRLSAKVGFKLPRGSTHVVDVARRVYEESGWEGLSEVAKTHFSITDKVTGSARTKK